MGLQVLNMLKVRGWEDQTRSDLRVEHFSFLEGCSRCPGDWPRESGGNRAQGWIWKSYPAIMHTTTAEEKFLAYSVSRKKACCTEKEYHACIHPRIKWKFLVHERAEKIFIPIPNRTLPIPLLPPAPKKSNVSPLGLTFFLEICKLR